jgi:C-terminal processing protease CtpA/Prc
MGMSLTAENGKILSDCIKRLNEDPEVTDIILDNRYNGGGYFETIVNYIYPYLFTTDATLNLEYTSPASETPFTETIHCEGKAENYKDVYMLSDKLTSSAADTLTALVKAHDLAVIIGGNTNGEGLAGTYYFDILPNSKIVFQYMGTEAFNPDGTNNSIHGTAPDIYLDQTADSILQRYLLFDDGYRIFEYDTMLNYDNQLLYVLEMIEKCQN